MNDKAEVALVPAADVAGGCTLAACWALLITLTTLVLQTLEVHAVTYSFLPPPASTAALALPRYANHVLLSKADRSYGPLCELVESARTTASTGRENRLSLLCDILRCHNVERLTIGTFLILVCQRGDAQDM